MSHIQEQNMQNIEFDKFREDFVDYMKGVVTKGGGSSNLVGMYGGQSSLKYKRKKMKLDDTVE